MKPIRWTRRRVLTLAGGTAGLALGLGGYAWRIEPHWVEFVGRELPLERLPPRLEGRTLVQVSDLHVGRVVDSEYLIDSLRKVAGLRPDLIALTGDFMTYRSTQRIDEVARVLQALPEAPLGRFAVLGNHDYGEGWSDIGAADRLGERLAGLGIELLGNDVRDVAGLQVAGIDDLWGPRFRPEAVLPRLDPGRPSVVLCHNPDAVDLPHWSGFRGWVLSGHTHGGQCKPPFLPPPLLPVKNRRYTAGAFEIGDGRRLYINRGLGYLHRVRFGVRPEITAFRLTRA
jgi:predicted MPP superfamily phosphohydrolase